jgi:sensor histidine kinase YesM
MHQSEVITIRQEIEHVQSYLEIQKYRFEDLFTYVLEDIPEDVLDLTILKLTLQPLVENSIQHGFEGLEGMGRISISAEVIEGAVLFIIRDNGVGMDEAALKRINGIETASDSEPDAAELGERRGLGLKIVADRLRIHYGNAYGLRICSEEGHGTVIHIKIPRSRGERV